MASGVRSSWATSPINSVRRCSVASRGGHGVDARPEFAELILAAGHDSLGVLPVRDAMTGVSQLADWADDAVAHHKTGTDSRRERGHTRQYQPLAKRAWKLSASAASN